MTVPAGSDPMILAAATALSLSPTLQTLFGSAAAVLANTYYPWADLTTVAMPCLAIERQPKAKYTLIAVTQSWGTGTIVVVLYMPVTTTIAALEATMAAVARDLVELDHAANPNTLYITECEYDMASDPKPGQVAAADASNTAPGVAYRQCQLTLSWEG